MTSCDVSYEVRYRLRGAPSSIGQNSIASIKYGRKLDDISKATISHVMTDPSCCAELGRLEPWADSVEIRQDGALVWAGPITAVEYSRSSVVVEAADELVWSRYRALNADYNKTQDSALHFKDVWDNAMGVNPRPVEFFLSNTGVVESRKYTLSYNRVLWFLLKEMLESSVDVVALGYAIHAGTLALGSPLFLNAEDFAGDIVVRKAGELYAGQVLVEGARSVSARYPTGVSRGEGIYPLVQDLVYDETLQSNASAEAVAKSRYDYSSGIVPRVVRAGDALQLRQGAVEVSRLIPSTIITLDVDDLCYSERQQYRLGGVDVEFTGGIETISISLQPIGTQAQLDTVTADDDRGTPSEGA